MKSSSRLDAVVCRALWSIGIVGWLLLLPGCATKDSDTDLFWRQSGQLPNEVRYALAQWVDVKGQDPALQATKRALQREDQRRVQTEFAAIVDRYTVPVSSAKAPSLRLQKPAIYRAFKTREQLEKSELRDKLNRLRERLQESVVVSVPQDKVPGEAAMPWHKSNMDRESFLEYLRKRNATFRFEPALPDMSDIDRATDFLDFATYALANMRHAEDLATGGSPDEAYRHLASAIQKQRHLTARERSRLRTTPFLRELEKRLDRYALAGMKQQVEQTQANRLASVRQKTSAFDSPGDDLDSANQAITGLEKALCDMLAAWSADDRRLRLLEQKQLPQFADLVRDCAVERGNLWQFALRRLGDRDRHWEVYTRAVAHTKAIDSLSLPASDAYKWVDRNQSGGLQPVRNALEKGVEEGYMHNLPRACEHYMNIGTREVNNRLLYGVAAGLGLVVEEIAGFAEKQGWDKGRQIPKLTQARAQYKSWRNYLHESEKHRLLIRGFTPEQLGATFVNDLHTQLSNALQKEPGLSIVLVRDQEKAKDTDYVIAHGNVAKFDVEEPTPSRSMRTVTRLGNVQEVPNPEYEERRRENKEVEGIPRRVWRGFRLKHVIHVVTRKLVAHVRVTFDLVGGGMNNPFEINQIYMRSFIQEEHHPINDTTEQGKPILSQKPLKEAPSVVLRIQDMPSHLEMEDWARKESLLLLQHELLRHFRSLPLRVAQRAEAFAKSGAVMKAANAWARCHELCRDIAPDPAGIRRRMKRSDSAHLKEQLAKDARVDSELSDLKQQVRKQTIKAVTQFLKETR